MTATNSLIINLKIKDDLENFTIIFFPIYSPFFLVLPSLPLSKQKASSIFTTLSSILFLYPLTIPSILLSFPPFKISLIMPYLS